MISVKDAQQKVISEIKPIKESEEISLKDSVNRVVLQDILAPFDQPPFSNSAMDGYALCSKNHPMQLPVKRFQSAGSEFCELEENTAYQIGTGAPLPRGADAVVMKEHVEVKGDKIVLKNKMSKGENVRRQGEDIKRGTSIFNGADKITEKNIGLLASCGVDRLGVLRKPRICYFATGDEIVEVGQKRKAHQIFNSNTLSLELLFKKQGCEFKNLGICRDDPKTHLAFIAKAKSSNADIIVITGGVSVGRHDFVKSTLIDAGAQILFHKVAIKPGKPILFAKLGDKYIFGLPGNPLSAQVGFYQFIYPAIQRLLNQRLLSLEEKKAFLLGDVKLGRRHKFLIGIKKTMNEKSYVIPLREGSGNVASFSLGDCFISAPIGERLLKKDSEVIIQSYGR